MENEEKMNAWVLRSVRVSKAKQKEKIVCHASSYIIEFLM